MVAPPRSGTAALIGSLAGAPGAYADRAGTGILEGVFELEPENRDWESNRLTAADVEPRPIEEIRGRLKAALSDRDGNGTGVDPSGIRWVDGTPRNALRVPFLDRVAPDALFVFAYRDPAQSLTQMLRMWESGGAVSYPELPGWSGPNWSFPLVPGWRELEGLDLPEIVVEQWLRITSTLLDDLDSIPPERWAVTDFKRLTNDPKHELERLCEFVGLEADERVTRQLRTLRDQIAAGDGLDTDPDERLVDLLPRTEELAERGRELLAKPFSPTPTADSSARADSPLRSVFTQSFAQMLEQLGSSLLVSTYQTGKLIAARHDRGVVNTHFRDFQRPMGLAIAPGRIAIGTRAEILDYRNFPEVAKKLQPPGRHDACFVPRNKHFTGDIRIHEIAFAQGELWIAATNFSCLATLDAEHSFIPRWKPPFITELATAGPLPPERPLRDRRRRSAT